MRSRPPRRCRRQGKGRGNRGELCPPWRPVLAASDTSLDIEVDHHARPAFIGQDRYHAAVVKLLWLGNVDMGNRKVRADRGTATITMARFGSCGFQAWPADIRSCGGAGAGRMEAISAQKRADVGIGRAEGASFQHIGEAEAGACNVSNRGWRGRDVQHGRHMSALHRAPPRDASYDDQRNQAYRRDGRFRR